MTRRAKLLRSIPTPQASGATLAGLSFYEIANNPRLLKQMTCEAGQDLTHTEQVLKLERLRARPSIQESIDALDDEIAEMDKLL